MKKELRPFHENIACEVCGRTILKGERAEPYLAPGGRRHQVCDLCFARAEHNGWLRESGAGELPTRVGSGRPEQRGGRLGRLLRRSGDDASANGAPAEVESEERPVEGAEPSEAEAAPAGQRQWKDPRHVRAVPTTAEVKVERALELFNGSEHQRTIAGLVRTLGPGWASAVAEVDTPSAVTLLVAWELSWYRFRIDLGDEADPIVLVQKGEELGEIEDELRDWNASVDGEGRIMAGVPG